MSNLLINESPLQVLPTLARAIGLNEAIVVQQLHYWLSNPKTGVVKDGVKWVHNTYAEWQENFPFWSLPTIQRVFADLEEYGIVISAQLDKGGYDRTKYYRIDYDVIECINLTILDDINLISSLIGITETTSKRKPDLVDAVIEFQIKPKAIQDALRDFFKLTPNWEKKEPREFMQWAMAEKITVEQIEFAANLYRSDKRFNWKIPDLKGIAEHWLELIESYRPKQEPIQSESDGGFRV